MISSEENALNLIARVFILFSLFLFSCTNENLQEFMEEENLLSPDQMIEILTDVHIVEGAKIGRKIMGDTLLMDDYYNKVFAKHSINKIMFEENFRYYSSEPKKMDAIYEKVVENLNHLQIAVPKWVENDSVNGRETPTKADSIATRALMDSIMKDSAFIDRKALKNLRPSKKS